MSEELDFVETGSQHVEDVLAGVIDVHGLRLLRPEIEKVVYMECCRTFSLSNQLVQQIERLFRWSLEPPPRWAQTAAPADCGDGFPVLKTAETWWSL